MQRDVSTGHRASAANIAANGGEALRWRVFLGYPACIAPVSRLYLTVSLVSRYVPV